MDERLRYAWAAGFLDGDGCFSLGKQHTSSDLYRSVHVSAAQVNTKPLNELADIFDIGKVRLLSAKKGAYCWDIGGSKDVQQVIPLVLPYLIHKRREAEIVLEFAGLIRRRGRTPKGKEAYSPQEQQVRRLLIEEMDEIRSGKHG